MQAAAQDASCWLDGQKKDATGCAWELLPVHRLTAAMVLLYAHPHPAENQSRLCLMISVKDNLKKYVSPKILEFLVVFPSST